MVTTLISPSALPAGVIDELSVKPSSRPGLFSQSKMTTHHFLICQQYGPLLCLPEGGASCVLGPIFEGTYLFRVVNSILSIEPSAATLRLFPRLTHPKPELKAGTS
jgi:hypothetical protein